jgi:sugar transferase (PEP-CTERM/EpsH1 system associated)
MDRRPLIVHVVFRFDYGGLENGVANVVNGLSNGGFRHAIVALTEATEFSRRLPADVAVYALGKRPGKDPAAYIRLFRLLRRLKPTAVHTRNLATLDCIIVAFLARVPVRIHGEHGWDVFDPEGTNRKYRLMRRVFSAFVETFVAVSEDLRRWLTAAVRIAPSKVARICNGVDVERFKPGRSPGVGPLPPHVFAEGTVVIGSVTRFSAIKDPLNLVEAFIRLRTFGGDDARPARLLMIGDGELRDQALARLEQAGAAAVAWLPGSRDDIPELMRTMDVFALGSLREGISNTILEAMASGLPVVATATGGNPELVTPDETGLLVPPGDHRALADAIAAYVRDAELRRRHGRQARERAVAQYSLAAMLVSYRDLYDRALARAGV